MVATPVLAGALLAPRRSACWWTATAPSGSASARRSVVIAGLLAAWLIGVHSFAAHVAAGHACSGWPAPPSPWPCRWPPRWYPPRAPGHRAWHRRRRQLGHRAGRAVRPGAGGRVRLAERGGPGRRSADASHCWCSCCSPRTAPTHAAAASRLPRISRLLRIGDCLVVHVLLQRHLRRFRRTGVLADHLLQRSNTASAPVHAGYCTAAVRVRRLAVPPAGRFGGRPRRWRARADASCMPSRRWRLRTDEHRPASIWMAHAGVRRRHAGARHGQRRGVPTGARNGSPAKSA